MLTEPKAKWPPQVPNLIKPQIFDRAPGHKPLVTFVLHACFLIQWHGLNILIDPIYSRRCSPVPFCGPARVREPAVEFDKLPPIDFVLISHNHYDHLDGNTVRRLEAAHAPQFICGLGDRSLLKKFGAKQITELDWWQSAPLFGALKVTFTQAQHWSGRGWFDHMKSLWGGFFIENSDCRIYFAGDTGYGPHFRTIRERLGIPDLSLLPVGAYKPRWFMREHHMDPEDAVHAHLDLQSRLSVGMHFGSFQLSNEGLDAPREDLARARTLMGIPENKFRIIEFGQTITVEPVGMPMVKTADTPAIKPTVKTDRETQPIYQSL